MLVAPGRTGGARHHVDRLQHGGAGSAPGDCARRAHQFLDLHEPAAEIAAGVVAREVLQGRTCGPPARPAASASPSASIAVVDALGASRSVPASSMAPSLEHEVGMAAERRIARLGDARPRARRPPSPARAGAAPPRSRPTSRARGAGRLRVDAAEVAVDGLGGVQEDRRGARGGQGRRDLLGDDPGFAHAGRHDPSAHGPGSASTARRKSGRRGGRPPAARRQLRVRRSRARARCRGSMGRGD
jgi:hypothetical protein